MGCVVHQWVVNGGTTTSFQWMNGSERTWINWARKQTNKQTNKQVGKQISAKQAHGIAPGRNPHILVRPLTSIGLILTLPKFHLVPSCVFGVWEIYWSPEKVLESCCWKIVQTLAIICRDSCTWRMLLKKESSKFWVFLGVAETIVG